MVKGRAAALADFRVDEVNGELMWETSCGDKACGGFAGTQTGIADAAHERFSTVESIGGGGF
jgi:hypothetical protein